MKKNKNLWVVLIVLFVVFMFLGACMSDDSEVVDSPDTNITQNDSSTEKEDMSDDSEEEIQISNEETSEEKNEHVHSFSDATCTSPKTCSECGITEGSELGHNWIDASCVAAMKCARCSETSGSPLGHNFNEGICSVCGANDPNFVREEKVWIPTNGGKKYHSKSSCSQMIDPILVTKSEAES